jgi:hypothetical protein
MRFKPGQKVVCIQKGQWDYGFGPKYNDIVTIEKEGFFKTSPQGEPMATKFWLAFEEWTEMRDGYRVGYAAKYFRPVAEISELTEILEAKPELA